MINQISDVELFNELRKRKALIVHCSRTGKGDLPLDEHGLLYPDDLIQKSKSCSDGENICCSVIWPTHSETFGPVGIVLRPRSIKSVTSISLGDAGSYIDPSTKVRVGYGEPISRETLQETFTRTDGYNEWNVQDADTIGIFVHPHEPWAVSCKSMLTEVEGYEPGMGEAEIIGSKFVTIPEIAVAFPGMRIYTFSNNELVEYKCINNSLSVVATQADQLYP